MPTQLSKPDVIRVASIDDDPDWHDHVRDALSSEASYFKVEGWEKPAEFVARSPKDYHLVVIDEYYGQRYNRQAGAVIDYCRANSNAALIVLSHNSPPIDPNDPKFQGIPILEKTVFLNSGGTSLRTAIRELLGCATHLPTELLDHAFAELRQMDLEETTQKSEFLKEIRIGNVLYPFTADFETEAIWNARSTECSFGLVKYPSFLTGLGPDSHSARQAFYSLFHRHFQRLLGIRDLNRSADDKAMWAIFDQIVDLTEYRGNRTLIVPHFLGKITAIDDDGTCDIAWLTALPTRHRLEDAPCLVNLQVGDFIEAIVEQRVLAQSILRIIDATKTHPPVYSEQKRANFWNQPASKA